MTVGTTKAARREERGASPCATLRLCWLLGHAFWLSFSVSVSLSTSEAAEALAGQALPASIVQLQRQFRLGRRPGGLFLPRSLAGPLAGWPGWVSGVCWASSGAHGTLGTSKNASFGAAVPAARSLVSRCDANLSQARR
ncbi:hypothetical protein L1887_53338 [Cichorium endivia]|nr:hypothetical protein L1887_53338 [Cichorium endivia]